MSLFSSHPSYLGIDIGSAGIKVVELRNENGRPRLLTYGFAEEPVDIIHDNSPKMQEKMALLIKKICHDSQATSKKTIAALPTFSVFSSIISLPAMDKKEIAKAVYWQAKKIVPMPLEEMTLDWKLLESSVKVKEIETTNKKASVFGFLQKEKNQPEEINKGTDFKVLIAAAPKKLVLRYVAVFKQAGLDLLSLETENFAMERSMVGGDRNPVMMVDVGNVSSDITVVENSVPILSRSVDVGGRSITQAIINSMHVDEKRAEQFKRDIGFTADQTNLPKIIESVINPIINEIKYCFDLYSSAQSEKRIEKIILSGGSSFLPQFDKYLAQLLNIKVYIGDPWARVIYPLELKPILMEIAPRFSVAVGLAMREIV